MWQLPPVKDHYIFSHTKLDQRPQIAPSHWEENFKIYYLTEKMRSKGDEKFGEVCDRIGRGTITDEDHTYLNSLVRDNPNAENNEMFKEGKISIIVTTNYKREQINNNKLNSLIPDEPPFVNLSIDKCTNMQNAPLPPEDITYTKTKGLPTKIILKVGAPVLITVNDQKYKEDGIVNGARGHIDSFQLEDGSQSTIKVLWIVFRDLNVGKRLRLDKQGLKGNHRTTNPLAVPIEITKTRFEINQGNHKYVRSQFPVILAYAVTAHKSQGESLEEVSIDFTPDSAKKKPFITSGSFYVAIKRPTRSENVYLKDFDPSYIKCNPHIAEKIDSMRLTSPYKFKKLYNDDEIFCDEGKEVKIGYLNLNGVLDAEHYVYLNNDKNLLNLDILILAETKLTKNECNNTELAEKLHEFHLLQRYDADDGMKHMGLLMMSPKKSNFKRFDRSMMTGFKDENCQGFIYGFMNPLYLRMCFIYLRPGVGSKKQIDKILRTFDCNNCDIIMGDLNLNPKHEQEMQRIEQLCHGELEIALNEETTTTTLNQIDHILVHKSLKRRVFVSSYYNFVSNHKCIVLRIGLRDNQLKNDIVSRLKHSSEKFMKRSLIREEKNEKNYVKSNRTFNEEIDVEKVWDSHDEMADTNNPTRDNFDLTCLEGTNWITSDIINEYGKLMTAQFKSTYVFSTHFLASLENRGVENMKGWTRSINIFEKDYLFFPVHENAHWYLVIIKNQEKTLEVLDPYVPLQYVPSSRIWTREFENCRNGIKEKIDSEHLKQVDAILNKYILKHHQCPSYNTYNVIIRNDIPQQKNEYDCGVFMLTFMKFTALRKEFHFETKHMSLFRQMIKKEIENRKIEDSMPILDSENECDSFTENQQEQMEVSDDQQEQMEVNDEDTIHENRPPSFENESGTICWLNSIIQLMLVTTGEFNNDSLLQHIFRNFKNAHHIQSTECLRSLVSEKKPELRSGQQDSFDFFAALIEFATIDKEWLLNPLTIYTKTVTACNNNPNHKSSAFQNIPDYYLTVSIPRGNMQIQDVIENEFTSGQLLNDWRCTRCNSYGGTKIKSVQDGLEPDYLLVKLQRAELDAYGRAIKNNSDIIPPLGFTVQTDDDNIIAYSLCGVLSHLGRSLNSGHYISEVKRNTEWWKCNDSSITKTTYRNLSKQGYGFLFQKM